MSKGMKAVVASWLGMRILEPDITTTEAAERLGIPRGTLTQYIYRATKQGLITFDDPLSRIEYGVIPKAIDNLEALLAEGDKTATLETVKGTVFKEYTERKGVRDTQMTVLSLKIETPAPGTETRVMTGHIVGKAKAPRPAAEEE